MSRLACIVLIGLLLPFGAIAQSMLTVSGAGHGARQAGHLAATGSRTRERMLVPNGSFESGTLRPWTLGGSLPPTVTTLLDHRGHYAALIGRLQSGPPATSTLALSVTIPARAVAAGLSLYVWQRCADDFPHSRLGVSVALEEPLPLSPPGAQLRTPQLGTPLPTLQPGVQSPTPQPRTPFPTPQSGVQIAAPQPGVLLTGCRYSRSWTRLTADLSPAIGRTVTITAAAQVAADETAALIVDDVAITATLPLTPSAGPTTTPTATATITPTATATDVPNICASPAISAAYNAALPRFSPTATPRPTSTSTVTPTITITATATATARPTRTAISWRRPTGTPTATPTYGPTPGYTATPGPPPTVGTTCHAVDKGISYGFVSHDGGFDSAATPVVGPAEAQAVVATGARLVRVDFHLVHDATWTPAEYGAYDVAVNAFANAHLDVLGLVGPGAVAGTYNMNAWIANSAERQGGNGDNAFLHLYAATVLQLIDHFHDRIHTWELWNEPNVGIAGMTGNYLYPSNFAAMLADTYLLVKSKYPDLTLVSGGILSHNIGGHSTPGSAGADYLRQTYFMGLQVTHTWDAVRARFGGTPLDAIGQHLYLDQHGLVYTRHIVDAYRWMHDAYGAFGDGAKPIYMTEGAWSTSAVSPTVQGLNLAMLYTMSQNPAVPYVTRAYWYLLRDGEQPDQAYGLETSDGQPKEAYYRFQAL